MAAVIDHPPPSPPETCAIALKEWSGICAALATGRQSILLRKGGIAEESGRFVPEHPAFWLYPTAMHQGQQGLRTALEGPPGAGAPGTRLGLSTLAVVAEVGFLDRLEALEALDDLHVWTEETVRSRFAYRRPGLWVLGVRVFVRPDPWLIEVTAEQAGCKSWASLDAPPPMAGLVPAPGDSAFTGRMERLRAVVDPDNAARYREGSPHDAD